MPTTTNNDIDLIEIKKIPRAYMTKQKPEPIHSQFKHFLGAMMHSNLKSGLRIQTIDGKSNLFLLTEPGMSDVLQSVFLAQFSGFYLQPMLTRCGITVNQPVFVAEIEGVPRQAKGALDGLVESMIGSSCPMLYQVWTSPARINIVSRKIIEKKYETALGKSQKQDSIEGLFGTRETRTKFDADALRSSKHLEAAYERSISDRVLECRVIIASWGNTRSKVSLDIAVNILLSTISRSAKKERMKHRIFSGEQAGRVLDDALRLKPCVKGTKLLPSEVVSLFEIPHIEMGIAQSSTTAFSTAGTSQATMSDNIPFRDEYVALGGTYRKATLYPSKVKYIKLDHLRRHAAVLGMTGAGKSSTKHRIVIDAWKNGVSSLLIEPVKTDARALMLAIDELRVFTIGREVVAPFRLNPGLIEEGLPVQPHIDRLFFSFLAAWPLYGILANHLRKVIVRTYTRRGWDVLNDRHGRPVFIQDFRDEGERYSNRLQYGSELRQDFKGAILTRIEDLCEPSRAAIFNTTYNLPVSELLRVPTILELGHIKDPEFKALMLNLILHRIEQYFEQLGPAESLRKLIIIDEAHRFLRELPQTLDMSEVAMSKRQVQDQLEDLTAEARSAGIGIIVLDQDPSQLSRRVLKSCHTKIVHRLESPDDVQLSALLLNCSPQQREHIRDMRDGEAIIRGLEDSVPLNIQVFYDPEFNPVMTANRTDEEVIERMRPFYDAHPAFRETPEIPILDPPEVIEDRDLVSLRVQVEDLVRSSAYQTNYLESVESPDAEFLNAIEELLVFYATRIIESDKQPMEVIEVLIEATEAVFGPLPYTLNPNVVQGLIRDMSKTDQSANDRRDLGAP